MTLECAVFYVCRYKTGQGTRQAERALGVARAACLEPMAGVFAIGVAARTIMQIGTVTFAQKFNLTIVVRHNPEVLHEN